MHPTTLGNIIASVTLLTSPALARTWAGPVDMQKACRMQYGPASYARSIGLTAYDWQCWSGGKPHSVDVNRYCRDRYRSNAYADPQGGGVFDWGCYYP